ncbi:MAG: helix-turn-helix domain-containing protein [Oscillospiraceae bacterium]|nr:helix-turn-helix domain-containing protein [Oscillospiraceae bacterium]
MNFKDILTQAQHGSEQAIAEVMARYKSLLLKESVCRGLFDEDLYQELCIILLNCIRNFRI